MNIVFYLIAGIFSCLIGWNISTFLIIDFVKIFRQSALPFRPDFVLLPILATCLTVSIIISTIYLSNPTHIRSNRRILPGYLKTALAIGGLAGLSASIITSTLYQTEVPNIFVRVVAWGIIGMATGLAEGLTWYWLDKEASTSETRLRIGKSTLFGLSAGILAAIIIELVRTNLSLGGYEDPIGFILLGVALGLSLNWAASPTYKVALRAGKGFESSEGSLTQSKIKNSCLKFTPAAFEEEDIIEEGLSIRLPSKFNRNLFIGSSTNADIYLPKLPERTAEIIIKKGEIKVRPLKDNFVKLQGKNLSDKKTETLRHNQILTFYHETNQDVEETDREDKCYCFVFYDRFLEPRA